MARNPPTPRYGRPGGKKVIASSRGAAMRLPVILAALSKYGACSGVSVSVDSLRSSSKPVRTIQVRNRSSGDTREWAPEEVLSVDAEPEWVLVGDSVELTLVESALGQHFCERIGSSLLLRFGNAVGLFPVLGRKPIVVKSGKLDEDQFEDMLAEVVTNAMALPFSWGERGLRGAGRGAFRSGPLFRAY